MTERSSGTSSKSSAASSKSSASSATSSKSNASSAASSKSGASSTSGSSASGSSAASGASSAKSGSTAGGDSETTEKTITEMGSQVGKPGSITAPAEDPYNRSMAQSNYAIAANNIDKYSMAGPAPGKQQSILAASKIKSESMNKKSVAGGGGKPTGRKVFIMRNGERMDRLFPEWLTVAITDEGKYRPYDMNQPLTMIERMGGVGWAAYDHDSPITEMGSLSGQMVGRGLKSCKVDVKQLVSSPALRCVQTANAILKAMENPDLKIKIEPGLFEWLTWYDKMPQWFEPQTLAQTGKYRIDELYKPIMGVADVVTKKNETTKEYCERVANVTKQLMDQYKSPGTTLVVGHGSTVDVVGRSLMGKPMVELNRGEMDRMGVKYPYCAVVAVEEMDGSTWKVIPSALPQLNFLGFSNRFDPDYFNRA